MGKTSIFRLLLAILFIGLTAFSFETIAQTGSTFTPEGKPVALIFSNVNSKFSESGHSEAFELTRVYLGYEYSFSKNFSSRLVFDVGDPKSGEFQMSAYVKNAFLLYKTGTFSARISMIGTDQFNIQEKNWGYRYIYKSFQDAYGMGPSADLGAGIEYSPCKYVSFDVSVLNGEGYKKVESDSALKVTAGITLKPFDGFILRGYSDYMKKNSAQTTFALFAGYTHEKLRVGAEYNVQMTNKMKSGHDFSGFSVYTSYQVVPKFSIFARYDDLLSETIPGNTNPWNYSKDGRLILAGFDYSPVKGVKIAPTYGGWTPADKSKPFMSTASLNFEIKF